MNQPASEQTFGPLKTPSIPQALGRSNSKACSRRKRDPPSPPQPQTEKQKKKGKETSYDLMGC